MSLRTTILLLVLGVAIALPTAAQPLRQVVTADEIRAAGLVRPAELLDLVDGWWWTSLDGLRGRADALGQGAFGDEPWQLWVDGHPVDVSLDGTHRLNRLPLLLQDVDSVVVTRGPAVRAGPLAPAGRIEIHTRRPAPGPQGAFTYWTGNDTGDPGPWRYVRPGGGNVDRLGPDIEATGTVREPWGWARAQALTRIHFPTYPALRLRIQEWLPTTGGGGREYPKSEMLAAAIGLRLDRPRGRHDLWSAVSELADFVYLEPLLRELPANSLWARLGVHGNVPVRDGLHLAYHAAATGDRLGRRPDALAFDPSLRVTRLRGGVEARLAPRRADVRAGAYLRQERAEAALPLAEPSYTVATLYAAATRRRAARRTSAALEARIDHHTVAWQGHAALEGALGDWTATVWLTLAEHLADDASTLRGWIRRGYPLLDAFGADHQFADALTGYRTLSGEAVVERRGDDRWEASAGGAVRRFTQVALTSYRLTGYDPTWRAFETTTVRTGHHAGTVASAHAALHLRPASAWHLDLTAAAEHAVHGDAAFADAWQARPTLRGDVRARFRAAPTFALYARLAYHGPARWPALDEAARLSDGTYRARVPGAFVLDLAATKWLWHRRLRGTLGVHNMADRAYRHHPLGAAFPLRLRVQVAARF